MLRHIKEVHESKKRLKCNKCGYTSPSDRKVRTQIKEVHDGKKDVVSDYKLGPFKRSMMKPKFEGKRKFNDVPSQKNDGKSQVKAVHEGKESSKSEKTKMKRDGPALVHKGKKRCNIYQYCEYDIATLPLHH